MIRPLIALAASALVAVPATAATYTAKTSTQAPAKIAARDILWTCGSGACTGSTQNSRPVVLCQGLAKQAGRIESFAVDGREMAAADLDRCNASARGDKNQTLANAR